MSIQQKFEDFDVAHPEVYTHFRHFANQIRTAGHTKYGAKTIIERIRWEMDLQVTDGEFKINNNFISRYARKLINEDTSFEGFFNLREIRTA